MVSGVSIRTASSEEINNLEIQLKVDPDQRTSSVLRGVDVVGEHVFLIDYLGHSAGFCTFRSAADEIFPLFVFTAYRRKGIGVEAMRQLIDLLQREGREEIFIEVINDAGPFWTKVFTGYSVKSHGNNKYTIDISQR